MSGETAMDTALTGTSVLIVEDNWLIALSLVETCRDAGAEIVGPASNVAQALGLIESQRIDIGLLDFALSSETASPIASCLQRLSLPILFYTGSPIAVLFHPGAHVLVKPCDGAGIVHALKTALAA
jgi:DNA-binding response OmpR family regulator